MRKFVRFALLTGAVAGLAGLAAPRSAEAGLTLSASFNGKNLDFAGANLTLQNDAYSFGGNESYAAFALNGEFRGLYATKDALDAAWNNMKGQNKEYQIAIQVAITDNAGGAGPDAKLFTMTHDVRNNGGGSGNATLTITAQKDNFLLPTGDVILTSAFTATGDKASNAQFSTYLLNSSGQVVESITGNGSRAVADLTAPFQLKNVTTLKINSNGNITTTGLSWVAPVPVAAVPEPSTIAMASVALGLIAVQHGRRRGQRARTTA